jgi:CheY-like chemotaxis protein
LSEMMGGSMWVESTGIQGQGSTFHFTVLIPGAQDDETAREGQLTVDLSGKRVLIVDDNLTNRKIVIGYTKAWSMLPMAVSSGREALELLQAGERFDLAILDYQMPEMDGLTLADEISRLLPEAPMDLVLLSSLGFRDTGSAKQRIAAYLTKPIKPSQLHDVLVGVISQGKVTPQKLVTSSQFDREMGSRHPLRILLAEDNLVNQKVALSLLMRIGYRADLAANGLEVLQALNRQEYDVVLMDGQMPEMDGEEATRQIRRDLPAAQQPQIIAMTANAMKGDRERYLATGMDDYVSKPIRLEELVRALSACQPLSCGSNPTPAAPQLESGATEEPVAGTTCIDPAVLASFVEMIGEGGEELAREITSMYIRDVPRLIQEMEQAVAEKDAELLRRAAHTLKGNSNQVGAVQLAALSLDLEQVAKTGSVDGAGLLDQIRKEFTRVETVLSQA